MWKPQPVVFLNALVSGTDDSNQAIRWSFHPV
jgi:hypothetical protein